MDIALSAAGEGAAAASSARAARRASEAPSGSFLSQARRASLTRRRHDRVGDPDAMPRKHAPDVALLYALRSVALPISLKRVCAYFIVRDERFLAVAFSARCDRFGLSRSSTGNSAAMMDSVARGAVRCRRRPRPSAWPVRTNARAMRAEASASGELSLRRTTALSERRSNRFAQPGEPTCALCPSRRDE